MELSQAEINEIKRENAYVKYLRRNGASGLAESVANGYSEVPENFCHEINGFKKTK